VSELEQRADEAQERTDEVIQELGERTHTPGTTIQEYEALCPGVNRRTLQRTSKTWSRRAAAHRGGRPIACNTLQEKDLYELRQTPHTAADRLATGRLGADQGELT